MGNLKISKTKKKKNSKGSSGIPNWLLSTLVILVVLAVLATCVGTFIASSGVVMRLTSAATLNNYKVTGNMMSYFYGTTYMNFTSNYQSYMSYLSLDQSKSPKNQTFNPEGSYDAAFLGEFEGTWHDYFMEQTKNSVKNLLLYCAKADELGIKLTDDDLVEIETSIDTLLIQIRSAYGTSLSDESCFANVYGDGVNRGDVRAAMKLSTLASKCSEQIGKDIEETLTDERVDKEYADNKLDYDLVDFYNYSFSVYYDDIIEEKFDENKTAESLTATEKEEVLALYKEKIASMSALAKELSEKKTPEEFLAFVLDYEVKDIYDDEFDKATNKLTSEQKPSDADLATIKDKMMAAVLADVNNKAESATDDVKSTTADDTTTYTLYDITVSSEFATAAKALKEQLFAGLTSAKDSVILNKQNYVHPTGDDKEDEDELSEWAFAIGRAANDTKVIEEGDGANGAENLAKEESFVADVYMLTKTVYRDETLSRDVAYMLFTESDKATAALDDLKALGDTVSKEDFEKIAKDESNPAAANTVIEDYVIGNMQSDAFDEWLFAETTTKGSYTATAIEMSDGALMIALYLEEGEIPAWKNTVKNALYADDYNAIEEKMNEDYGSAVTFNTKIFNKIGF